MSPEANKIGTVDATHIWKRFRADHTRSRFRDTMSAIRHRKFRPGSWVLRDVNLQVEQGDSVGLIGLNGSGKSTLLKVLSGVTPPNAGRLQINGRIGALIEVRAGISPELTGRENIFFYGTVLGLSRKQVTERFSAIVDFAELNDSVDRQVKYYSSGMQMRLGFAIAAFLEPDILLVDEALAVGDIGFQQRCLERMKHVLDQGTTLIFVSHDLSAVEAMCKTTMWLDSGFVRGYGPTQEVMAAYREGLEEKAAILSSRLEGRVRVSDMVVTALDGGGAETGRPLKLTMTLHSDMAEDMDLCIGVSEGPSTPIFTLTETISLKVGANDLGCVIDSLPLPRGRYFVWVGAFSPGGVTQVPWHPAAPLVVEGPPRRPPPRGVMLLSPVHVSAQWDGDVRNGSRGHLVTEGSASTSSVWTPA